MPAIVCIDQMSVDEISMMRYIVEMSMDEISVDDMSIDEKPSVVRVKERNLESQGFVPICRHKNKSFG
jgi:hypothetical protein